VASLSRYRSRWYVLIITKSIWGNMCCNERWLTVIPMCTVYCSKLTVARWLSMVCVRRVLNPRRPTVFSFVVGFPLRHCGDAGLTFMGLWS
jgi:hypothetical protein